MKAPSPAVARGLLEDLSRDDCLALLATVPFGRIAFTYHAMPAVQPVDFLLDGDRIVIGVRPGSQLASAADNTIVAFQADQIDPVARTGWTVTVIGRADEIRDEADRSRTATPPLRRWADGGRDHMIQITQNRVLAGDCCRTQLIVRLSTASANRLTNVADADRGVGR